LPESWILPEHLLELRAQVGLRKTLVDQRTECPSACTRSCFIRAVPAGFKLWSRAGGRLDDVELSPAGPRSSRLRAVLESSWWRAPWRRLRVRFGRGFWRRRQPQGPGVNRSEDDVGRDVASWMPGDLRSLEVENDFGE